MAFNATSMINKTASYTALAADNQINVTPAAATTITLPQISTLAASGYGIKSYYIQNVDGAYAVTVTADTTKPDYLASREKPANEAGPVIRTYTSIQLTGATDYVLIETDPQIGYWWIKEMGLSTSYHGAMAQAPQTFNFTAVGTAAINGMDIQYNDMTTYSSGYSAGIYIVGHNTGAKTGGTSNSQVAGLAIDFFNHATTAASVVGINVYLARTGTPTTTSGAYWGMQIYIDEIGTAQWVTCLFLSKANATVGTANDSFIHMANQGSGATTEALHFHGPNATYLFGTTTAAGFLDAGSGASASCNGHIAVNVNGTAKYLRLYASVS